jgi:hypothetical protein
LSVHRRPSGARSWIPGIASSPSLEPERLDR